MDRKLLRNTHANLRSKPTSRTGCKPSISVKTVTRPVSVEQPSIPEPTPVGESVEEATAPVAVVLSTGCETFRPLVSQYDWDVNTALAVMRAESSCRPDAFNGANRNGSNDAGLFQVNSIHVRSGLISDHERFDPTANVKAAYAIYEGSGWKAWVAYSTGAYKKWL